MSYIYDFIEEVILKVVGCLFIESVGIVAWCVAPIVGLFITLFNITVFAVSMKYALKDYNYHKWASRECGL